MLTESAPQTFGHRNMARVPRSCTGSTPYSRGRAWQARPRVMTLSFFFPTGRRQPASHSRAGAQARRRATGSRCYLRVQCSSRAVIPLSAAGFPCRSGASSGRGSTRARHDAKGGARRVRPTRRPAPGQAAMQGHECPRPAPPSISTFGEQFFGIDVGGIADPLSM